MEERSIEPSDARAKAELSLSFTSREIQLVTMALGKGASDSEVEFAAIKFIRSLRSRGVRGDEFDALLEKEPIDPPVIEPLHQHVHRHRTDEEILTSFVTTMSEMAMPGVLSHLHSQMIKQCLRTGRI
jgi:hypothetical protein